MPQRLRRSLHFVPGGNERMHAKALGLPVDGLIFDLEDSVPPDRKVATRAVVRGWLTDGETGGRERWVRMNPLFSGFGLGDLEETIAGRPDGYLVPKPRAAADVREIAEQLDRLEEHHGIPNGTTRLLPIATETPEGLFNIREVAAASPRVAAISWGIEDLGASMGLACTRDGDGRFLDVPRHARLMCVLAAAAAGVEALDTVYTDVDDLDGLRRECEEARAMGFAGKLSLHPAQVDVPECECEQRPAHESDRRDPEDLHAGPAPPRPAATSRRSFQRRKANCTSPHAPRATPTGIISVAMA